MTGFAQKQEPRANTLEVTINREEFQKLLKKYKKIKKYMKSSYYAIRTLDGSETIVKNLLTEKPPDA